MARPYKHGDEMMLRAMEMYCQGETIRGIGRILKIPANTVSKWKIAGYPDDWDKKRDKRLHEGAEALAKNTLEEYVSTRQRHQKMLRSAITRLALRITRATDAEISITKAVENLPVLIAAERELYMDPEELIRIKNRAMVNINNANLNPESPNVMSFLQGSFDGLQTSERTGEVRKVVHNHGKQESVRDTIIIQSEPDGPKD